MWNLRHVRGILTALSENYEIAYFRSVKNLLQHPLKSMSNVYGCERDRTNFAILNFSATVDLLEKRREHSSAELLKGELRYVLGFHPKDRTWQRNLDYRSVIDRVVSHALKNRLVVSLLMACWIIFAMSVSVPDLPTQNWRIFVAPSNSALLKSKRFWMSTQFYTFQKEA